MTRDLLAIAGLTCITIASFLQAAWLGVLTIGVLLVVLALVLSVLHGDERIDADVEEVQQAPSARAGAQQAAWSGISLGDDADEPQSTLERLMERDRPKFRGSVADWVEVER